VELLTDGTASNPILDFCQSVISRHAENWPPTENALAEEFVGWLGAHSLMTPTVMQELCLSKGINLSFVPLPAQLHGVNCTFQDKNVIVISDRETVPFAHVHTLFHEFREILEHVFVERGYATLTQNESLEAKAEEFAMTARMETLTRELPTYFKMVSNIEKNWPRYFGYAFLIIVSVAYMFGCALLPRFEDMMSEARRQRYVRT
jgi:hypothetical protein